MYQNLGMDLPACAKFLHVTERTLRNWESGKHDIPYAAYRLLRLTNRMELPGDSWAGWSFYGGKLISPEGRVFVGTDSAWWSLLIRRATKNDREASAARTASAPPVQRERAEGALAGSVARCPTALDVGRREAPALDLSNRHFRTPKQETKATCRFPAHSSFSYQPLFNAKKDLP